MGQDTPDWGGNFVNTAIFPLEDMGELASRLGSPIRYDRRGSLVYVEDFENGIRDISTSVTGAASEVALSAAHGVTGGFCARIRSGTNANDQAQLIYRVPQPTGDLVSAAAFAGFANGNCEVYFSIDTFTGTVDNVFTFKWTVSNTATVAIQTASGYVTLDSNYILSANTPQFGFFKAVINQTTGQPQRLIVDRTEYDLTGYTFPTGSASTYKYLGLTIQNLRTDGSSVDIFVDSLLFMANEPENT